MQEQEAIRKDIEAALAAVKIDLLEFTVGRHRGDVQVHAVIYSATGTGTAECTKAHNLIASRLETGFEIIEPFIEVSSPGIDRVFRSAHEYEVFAGQGIRYLPGDETEWRSGRLLGLGDGLVRIEADGETIAIPLAGICKAKLDSTREGKAPSARGGE
jgi:ribosome maturation factor RimP